MLQAILPFLGGFIGSRNSAQEAQTDTGATSSDIATWGAVGISALLVVVLVVVVAKKG